MRINSTLHILVMRINSTILALVISFIAKNKNFKSNEEDLHVLDDVEVVINLTI